ncbi:type I-F CRISPR-associated protein Csy3 [Candidatus Tenderia electrophaga]|jgi:CRISPR-associated protein Csy3|uniref:Type I-F CRISPR-associated protein Csy3 n=1 Tax=Candidatus Tenderia electrophaga TaxID=1748243 RepID=A0A0S2TF72_9GAMM|nr:type I-F CRISPR-associated protein Csy3 [Candidatus Tenderia electrophaga]
MAELKTASVLAFERKLDPSDALFSAGAWGDQNNGHHWPAVTIREKSVRGTISNRLKTKDQDPAKLDASIQAPNLQTVDVAMLPNDADTLRARFTLKVLGGAGTPSACNSADYQQQLQATVNGYVDQSGFGELAKRYAHNIANGRFLWRNRLGAEQVAVQVNHLKDGSVINSWEFNALDFSLRNFSVPSNAEADFKSLAGVIENGLAGKEYTLVEIVAYVRVGDGQEIYPSQELILDRGSQKGQKSKTLYSVGEAGSEVAAMHSQKIGNALRTIDTWYDDVDGIGPIAVEPYGSVTSQGKAYRQPKQKIDFYNLLDNWVLKGKEPEEGHQHYVMATLIRGGVFGSSEKD